MYTIITAICGTQSNLGILGRIKQIGKVQVEFYGLLWPYWVLRSTYTNLGNEFHGIQQYLFISIGIMMMKVRGHLGAKQKKCLEACQGMDVITFFL